MDYIVKRHNCNSFRLTIRNHIYKSSKNLEELILIRDNFFKQYDYKDTKYIYRYKYGFIVTINYNKKVFKPYNMKNSLHMKLAYIKAKHYVDSNPETFDLNFI